VSAVAQHPRSLAAASARHPPLVGARAPVGVRLYHAAIAVEGSSPTSTTARTVPRGRPVAHSAESSVGTIEKSNPNPPGEDRPSGFERQYPVPADAQRRQPVTDHVVTRARAIHSHTPPTLPYPALPVGWPTRQIANESSPNNALAVTHLGGRACRFPTAASLVRSRPCSPRARRVSTLGSLIHSTNRPMNLRGQCGAIRDAITKLSQVGFNTTITANDRLSSP